MKEIKIIKLENGHPAAKWGYKYNAQIWIDGVYCGAGKFFRTEEEAKKFASEK